MAKAGVHLLDIQDGEIEQHALDLDKPEIDRSTMMLLEWRFQLLCLGLG